MHLSACTQSSFPLQDGEAEIIEATLDEAKDVDSETKELLEPYQISVIKTEVYAVYPLTYIQVCIIGYAF